MNLKYKRNINFLDKPLFIPSRTSITQQEYLDGKGYGIKCPEGLPVAYDIDVLNFLMHRAQLTWKPGLEFKTMRDLLKHLGYTDGKANYEMVERSLHKWSQTKINFKNRTFYKKGGRRITVRDLSILTYERSISNSVLITFDDDFFYFNTLAYSQLFPIRLMTKLTPYSKRVFEILKKNDKNLYAFAPWKIGFDKLKLKMPTLAETPSSKLLWSLKKSVEEINTLLPRFGMPYCYRMERDPGNKDNAMVRKLPFRVRISRDSPRILVDDVRSWVNEWEGEIVDDGTFFRILNERGIG